MRHTILILCIALAATVAFADSAPEDTESSGELDPEAAAAAAAQQKKNAPLCAVDKDLRQVAMAMATKRDVPPSAKLVEAVREAGIDANPVYAKFGATGETDEFRAWLTELRDRADAPLICGRGRSGEQVVVITAVRGGELRPVGKNGMHASVIEDFRDPYLVVRDTKGETRRVPVDGEGSGSTIQFPPDWGRPLLVQLVATGPNGPRPLAERWLGTAPRGKPSRAGNKSPASWLRQLRGAAGVRSLRPNRLLDREAKAHSQAVCDSGKVGHELDPYGDPEARLLARGIEARVVGEAVARANTQAEALHAIEDSPSHRITVTDARFTDVGYGTVKDSRGRSCVVVLLAAWPRKIP